MQITLLKDLETPQGRHKAGEVVEVDEATYDWLMASYMEERQRKVQEELLAQEKLAAQEAEKAKVAARFSRKVTK